MRYIILLFSLLTLSSCKSCNNNEPPKPQDGRTVVAFILANNNLNSYGIADINEMEASWSDNYGGTLYVFLNTTKNRSILYRIVSDKNPNAIASTIIREYPTNIDPCNADFVRSVFDEIARLSPAKSYGMFLWSHGSGWLPKGSSNPLQAPVNNDNNEVVFFSKLGIPEPATSAPSTDLANSNNSSQYTIGDNQSFNHSAIETYELARTFEGLSLEYIYFDACHMASIEMAYALRNCAKYTIASTAETLATGAPYDRITKYMFGTKESTIEMARQFYNYYSGQSGFMQSGTISVVENKKLEAAATELKKIVTANPEIPFSEIQQYGRNLGTGANYRNIFFDLSDFVIKTWGLSNPEGQSTFQYYLQEAVIYQAATPTLFNSINVKTHCGLSTYIPQANQTKTLKIYREKYEWATDSGLGNMVD